MPGSVKLQDVAAMAGVHLSTASRALNSSSRRKVSPETAAHVAAVARDLGYSVNVVAKGLRSRTTSTIGVIVADFGNTYVTPMIRGIADAFESQGYMSVVAETQDDHDRLEWLIAKMTRRQVDGIICCAARLGDAKALQATAEAGTPIVLAVRGLPDSGLLMVTHDEWRGGQLAAAHLADLGHRRVAQLVGPSDMDTFCRRSGGFLARARERSLEDLTINDTAVVPSIAEGHRLMTKTLASVSPPPTAIFAANDLMALGAIDALAAAGLSCPADVSVIGYNDAPLMDHVSPPLTTIRVNSLEIGRIAALTILAALEDKNRPPDSSVLLPQLVVRASTTAPRRELVNRKQGRHAVTPLLGSG